MKIAALCTSVIFVLGASVSSAQPWGWGPYGPWGGSYWGGGGTVAESQARGMSDLIRAQGVANLLNSEAAINFDEARRSAIETQKQYTESYFALREMNREARAREHGERPISQDFIRYAQMGKPDRLNASQLDPVTGELNWPILLTTEGFAAGRADLEQAFQRRASHGVLDGDAFTQAARTAEQMLAALQEQVRELPPQQYIQARKFLESVRFEAGIPAG
jgi:hypothetical protein